MPAQGSEARAGKQQLNLFSAPWECSLKAPRNMKRKESRKSQPGLRLHWMGIEVLALKSREPSMPILLVRKLRCRGIEKLTKDTSC